MLLEMLSGSLGLSPQKPTLLQEQRADICGKKSGKVVGSKKTIRYEAW